MTILRGLIHYAIRPNIIRKGKNILLLEVPELSIRFLNSNNYLSGSEYEIADQYGIPCKEKKYFPQNFLLFENLNYIGEIPELKYFQSFFDVPESLKMKQSFISEFNNTEWKLLPELLMFVRQKQHLLIHTMLVFLNECFLLWFSIFLPLFQHSCY